jgi:hypothetical protein
MNMNWSTLHFTMKASAWKGPLLTQLWSFVSSPIVQSSKYPGISGVGEGCKESVPATNTHHTMRTTISIIRSLLKLASNALNFQQPDNQGQLIYSMDSISNRK